MTSDTVRESTRVWLSRLALSVVVGVAIGLLAYLAARGVAGIALLSQQQALLGNLTSVLGSLDGPPTVDLRAVRKTLQALDQQYAQLSAVFGLAVGTLVALLMYLRLERSS